MVTSEQQRALRRLTSVLRKRVESLGREHRQRRDVGWLRAGALLVVASFAVPYFPSLLTLPTYAMAACRYVGIALIAVALLRRSSAA